MCKVYNQIGCLTEIQAQLRKHKIFEYNSIKQLINFQKTHEFNRQQIIADHKVLIEKEKSALVEKIIELAAKIDIARKDIQQRLQSEIDGLESQLNALSVDNNFMKSLINKIKKVLLARKIRHYKLHLNRWIDNSLRDLRDEHHEKK